MLLLILLLSFVIIVHFSCYWCCLSVCISSWELICLFELISVLVWLLLLFLLFLFLLDLVVVHILVVLRCHHFCFVRSTFYLHLRAYWLSLLDHFSSTLELQLYASTMLNFWFFILMLACSLITWVSLIAFELVWDCAHPFSLVIPYFELLSLTVWLSHQCLTVQHSQAHHLFFTWASPKLLGFLGSYLYQLPISRVLFGLRAFAPILIWPAI